MRNRKIDILVAKADDRHFIYVVSTEFYPTCKKAKQGYLMAYPDLTPSQVKCRFVA